MLNGIERKTITIALILVVLTVSVRLIDIDKPYEIWDEITSYTVGLQLWYNVAHLDFNPNDWMISPHPPVARYIYGLVNGAYLFSTTGTTLLHVTQQQGVALIHEHKNMIPGRILSAFFAAFTVLLTFLAGMELLKDRRKAALAAVFLAITPAFIGFTKVETPDPITIFFFTLAVVSTVFFARRGGNKHFALTLLSTGLAIASKFNNLSLFVVVPLVYIAASGGRDFAGLWRRVRPSAGSVAKAASFFIIPPLMLVALWPRLWSNPVTSFFEVVKEFSFTSTTPEYFLGGFAHPIYYYLVYFIVATPLLLLMLGAVGALKDIRRTDTLVLLAWLTLPIAFMSFSMLKQTGIKNVLLAYPALMLLASIGVSAIAEKLKVKHAFYVVSGIVIAYLAISSAMVHPNYIDYYNELVGGTSGVQRNRLFALGYWGEDVSGIAQYLPSGNHTIQWFVMPKHVIPPNNLTELNKTHLDYLIENGVVNESGPWFMNETQPVADYLVENLYYHWYVDTGFQQRISGDYTLVGTFYVNGAPLEWLFKKNSL